MRLSERVIAHAKEINTNGELRLGQSYVCSLYDISPHLYKVISENDELDCFYNDKYIDNFIKFLDGGDE